MNINLKQIKWVYSILNKEIYYQFPARGESFSGARTYKRKKRIISLWAYDSQGDRPVRFPSRILVCWLSHISSCGVLMVANFVLWWWSDVLWGDVVGYHVVGFWGSVRTGNVVGREMSCCVMLCHMMWCGVIPCRVMLCDVMQWDGMIWDVMWCDGMWLYDVLNWEMICCELRRAYVTTKPVRRPF